MVGWVLLDLDGVIYRGDSPIEGSREAIESLNCNGFKTRYLTNNATLTEEELGQKLAGMGIKTKPNDILTSGKAASMYLKERKGQLLIYPVGSKALEFELKQQGHRIVDWREAQAVVACLDFDFDYAKLANSSNAIRNGALFVATNRDSVIPVERGLMPGAGAIVSAIEVASGVRAISIGKPETEIASIASRSWGLSEKDAVVVGDRLDTDIALGNRIGAITALVLTGFASSSDAAMAKSSDEMPNYVFRDLKEFSESLIEGKIV